jgi:hypothetical protein
MIGRLGARALWARDALVACALALGLGVAVSACRHNEGDSIVVTGDGNKLSSQAIDGNPLALLPANPVLLGWVDAQAFFASPLGGELSRLCASHLPLGKESGFEAKRDLKKVFLGAYSMAGADGVAVAQGDFRPDEIKAAAERHAATPIGVPVVHSVYAGNDVYTAGNIGFTVVTQHTLLFGNETGMRRALDRIRDNRVNVELPAWMVRLMDNPQASLIVAGDVTSQPAVAALSGSLPFLNGLQNFRVLGNFQSPGINFAGTLTYPDPTAAGNAANSARGLAQLAGAMNVLRMFGLGSPLQALKVEVRQNDMTFVMAVDSQTATRLLAQIP